MEFDPKKHICKFFFQRYGVGSSEYTHIIKGDLYQKELIIEIKDEQLNEVANIGFSLKYVMEEILPMLEWNKYEMYRGTSGFDFANIAGYRDGWGYMFVCMNESGKSLISLDLAACFEKNEMPVYEKLLAWLTKKYSNAKELKEYKLHW